jgi:cation transport regulator
LIEISKVRGASASLWLSKQVKLRELDMPYPTNAHLPPSVRNHLPAHAQSIYREAFNHAFAAHEREADREERAHRIAWAAVKRSYVKSDGEWIMR